MEEGVEVVEVGPEDSARKTATRNLAAALRALPSASAEEMKAAAKVYCMHGGTCMCMHGGHVYRRELN